MKKRFILLALTAAALLLFSSCVVVQMPGEASPTATVSQTVTPAQPSPSQSAGGQETNAPLPSASAVEEGTDEGEDAAEEESCAFITGMSMRMDGQTDITFDYVDWLSGDEARDMYLEDHPGATEEEMEGEGLYEIGYIRNVNPRLRTYPTGDNTEYYLPDPGDIAMNVQVSYDTFLDRMFPAVDDGVDEYLTFVRVRVADGVIESIEWLYRP